VPLKTLARADDKAEIVRRLQAVQPGSARRWGRMSAHQMVCHLCDSFRMALGDRAVSEMAAPLRRTLVKWFALYAPLRWPPGIKTRPEIDQCLGAGTAPAQFADDLALLQALVEKVSSPGTSLEGRRHPVFGPMTHRAWMRWGYLHTDHHLRQFGA
jgi:hypothetical protein